MMPMKPLKRSAPKDQNKSSKNANKSKEEETKG